MDRPEVRVDPISIPPLPFEGARIQRERITKQDIDDSRATIDACNTITDNNRAQVHRTTTYGAERLDRRNEVINEALAEEVRRGEQRKKGSDRATVAVPETESAAPEPRENTIEAEANPKRRVPHEVSIVDGPWQWTAKGRGGRSQMTNRDCKLRTRRRWALVKAQR